MHRYIQARLMSDFAQEFSQDLQGSKPHDRRQPAPPAEQPQTQSAQQLSFEFAMPSGR